METGKLSLGRKAGEEIYIGDENTAFVSVTDVELALARHYINNSADTFIVAILARLIDSLGPVIVTAEECHTRMCRLSVKAPKDIRVFRGEIFNAKALAATGAT